ncbi:trigger factor [bacterium]|nr:trigger factor [bacterium]MBU1071867.1 trigger factor [bacterium]MBU1676020.1 trigger factor [bacterium]
MTTESEAGAPAGPFKLTLSEPETWKRVLQVEIDRDYFEGEYGKNLRQARKGHTRPGFRKGKVPLTMVEQDLGGEVRMDTLEKVVPRAYQAALVEHRFMPVSDPVMDDLHMEEGEPVKISLAVEVRPEIVVRDYDDLPLRQREVALPDGAVDETLERLRDSRAAWDLTESAAASGDRLIVDITPLDDEGRALEEKIAKDYAFVIGAEGNFEAFDEAMTGTQVGDERQVTVTYPADYSSEELRGLTVTYRIVVKGVSAKQVPEFDDAFASSLKEGQTLLELRANIRDELLAEEQKKVDHEIREQIVDLLVERNPFELPPSLISRYLESSVEEMKQRSAYLGKTPTDEQIAAYRETGRPRAERSIKAMVILEAIRKQEDIVVTAEQLAARIDEIAERSGFPVEGYRDYVESNGDDERIRHDLGDELTFAFLRSRAKFE